MHVMRYAGGLDKGGFGLGSSSFAGKSIGLTGVDELDLYDFNNNMLFAQTSQRGLNNENDYNTELYQVLAYAKNEFDEMIQKGKDDFTALVNEYKLESTQRRDQVNLDLSNAAR